MDFDAFVKAHSKDHGLDLGMGLPHDEALAIVRVVWDAATLAEREACARLAEETEEAETENEMGGSTVYGEKSAAAIRARWFQTPSIFDAASDVDHLPLGPRAPTAGLLHIRDGRVIRVSDYSLRFPKHTPGLAQYMDGERVVYERTYQEGEEIDSYIEAGKPCGLNYYTGRQAIAANATASAYTSPRCSSRWASTREA